MACEIAFNCLKTQLHSLKRQRWAPGSDEEYVFLLATFSCQVNPNQRPSSARSHVPSDHAFFTVILKLLLHKASMAHQATTVENLEEKHAAEVQVGRVTLDRDGFTWTDCLFV